MASKQIIFLIVILLCASGCEQERPLRETPTTSQNIVFSLAPAAAAQQFNITRIDLTVSASDIEPPLSVSITDIDQERRVGRGAIEVPSGENRTFLARAFDADGCPVLSRELKDVTVTSEGTRLDISLETIPVVIGIRPEQTQLTVGDEFEVEVHLTGAHLLFGFTGEVEFDENILELIEIRPGNFFGEDALFLGVGPDGFFGGESSEFPGDIQPPTEQQNRLSLGITQQAGDDGVCGEGTAFRMRFRAAAPGNAQIRFIQNDKLVLTTTTFERIEDSEIRIEASPDITIQ